MNKFESRQLPPNLETNQGWVVQVYGRNRRLLCVLDPSHAWMFGIGCGVGLLLAFIWMNAARYSTPTQAPAVRESPAVPTDLPALQLD